MTRLRKTPCSTSSASQLRPEHRPCLYPRHRGFREVLPPFARSPRPRTYSRVPGSPVSRLQTFGGDHRRPHRCSAFSLRQDAPTALSSRSHSISKTSEADAHGTESGRGGATHCVARNLMHRTMLMMLYATGLRRAGSPADKIKSLRCQNAHLLGDVFAKPSPVPRVSSRQSAG